MSRGRRWKRVEHHEQRADVHVLPVGDLRVHVETRDCWCKPTLLAEADADGDVIVVAHNSYDGRELVDAHGVN